MTFASLLTVFGCILLICQGIEAQGEQSKATYCAISQDHTMCKYPKGVFGPACNKPIPYIMTATDKKTIVDIHNQARSQVALGKNPAGNRFTLPSAANMNSLVWDDELAAIAERWVYQCKFDHDSVRSVANNRLEVGQNAFLGGASSTGVPMTWSSLISSWFVNEYMVLEEETFDEGWSANWSKDAHGNWVEREATGHLREVTYGGTTSIGCAVMRTMISGSLKAIAICNYGGHKNPSGTKSYYLVGSPVSHCPSGFTGNKSTGLCVPNNQG